MENICNFSVSALRNPVTSAFLPLAEENSSDSGAISPSPLTEKSSSQSIAICPSAPERKCSSHPEIQAIILPSIHSS